MGNGVAVEASPSNIRESLELRSMKGVMSSWDQYVRTVHAPREPPPQPSASDSENSSSSSSDHHNTAALTSSCSICAASSCMLTLEAFEVDYQAACIAFLHQRCEKLPSSHKPRNLCITFNQFDPQVLYGYYQILDEATAATETAKSTRVESTGTRCYGGGHLSRWLLESGLGAQLQTLILRPTLTFAGTSMFTDPEHKYRFHEAGQGILFAILEALSSMDFILLKELTIHELLDEDSSAALHRLGTLLHDILIRAGRPSSPPQINSLSSSFLSSSSLTLLSLQDIWITRSMAHQIAQGLQGAGGSQLETLSLVRCGIRTSTLDIILSGLLSGGNNNNGENPRQQQRPQLRQVLLSCNNLTADVMSTSLAQLLSLAPNLEELDCSYNESFFSSVADTIVLEESQQQYSGNNHHLSLDHFHGSQLDWETYHIIAFAQALQGHGGIRHLLFRHIRPHIPASTTPLLVSRVFGGGPSESTATTTTTTLQLDLFAISREASNKTPPPLSASSFCLQQGLYSHNADLSVDAIGHALEGLGKVPTIDELKLQGCHLIGATTGQALESFLRSRHHNHNNQKGRLVKLVFYQCKMNGKTASYLVRGLRETQCIESLLFEFTSLTDVMVGKILSDSSSGAPLPTTPASDSFLPRSSRHDLCMLRSLSFRSGQLTLNSLDHFTNFLLHQPKLTCLDLSLNNCLLEGMGCESKIQAFCTAIERHPCLEKLALSLGSNHHHSLITIRLLFRALEVNHTLQKLVLKDSLSLPTHSDWTFRLGRLKGLTHLLLPQIFLDDANWDVFMAGLQQNTCLLRCDFDRSGTLRPIAHVMQRNYLLACVKSYNNGTRKKHTYINPSLLPSLFQKLGSTNSHQGSPIFSFLIGNAELVASS